MTETNWNKWENWKFYVGMGLVSLGILFLLLTSLSAWNVLYCGMPTYTRYVWEGSAAGGMGGYVLVAYEYSPWDFDAAFASGGFMLAAGVVLLLRSQGE